MGKVVVVAPADPHSGMSHAITVKVPLRIEKVLEEKDLLIYKCYGTPVDCVKMAFNHLLTDKPDLLVSGINHGSNASTSVFYSGTMGAALEGCINEIPSVGFSLLNLDYDADFTAAKHFADLHYFKGTGEWLTGFGLPECEYSRRSSWKALQG